MKTNTKRFAVILLVCMLASVSVFAKGKSEKGHGDFVPENCGPEESFGSENCRAEKGRAPEMRHPDSCLEMRPAFSVNLLGKVVSVDEKSGIIVIKDIDGNDVKVHLSDFTKIAKTESNRKTISDIKVGCSVAVQKFNTNTKIIEAAIVFVKEG